MPSAQHYQKSGMFLLLFRRGGADFFAGLVGILGEVVVEHVHQLVGLGGVGGFILPAVCGVQDFIRHAAASGDDGEAEAGVGFSGRFGQFAAVDGVQYGAGVFELDALAHAICATRPAGIHEPDVDIVALDFFSKQLGIFCRMPDHEGRAKAGGECGRGFGNANFGACHFGGIAGNEVKHGLRRREFGYRRQYAEGIAGEEDDIGRQACLAGNAGVFDMLDGIGATGVFGDAGIGVINYAILHTININIQKVYTEILGAMGEDAVRGSKEQGYAKEDSSPTPTLDRYSRDLTKIAREGKLDPVIWATA